MLEGEKEFLATKTNRFQLDRSRFLVHNTERQVGLFKYADEIAGFVRFEDPDICHNKDITLSECHSVDLLRLTLCPAECKIIVFISAKLEENTSTEDGSITFSLSEYFAWRSMCEVLEDGE